MPRRFSKKSEQGDRRRRVGPVDAPSNVSLYTAILVVALVGRPAEWIEGLSFIPITRIAFLIAAFVAFRSAATLVPVRIMSVPNLRSGILFLGLAICSIAFSIYMSRSLQYMQGPITLLLSMILLVKTVTSVSDLERVFVALVLSALALALGTLMEYQGGRADIDAASISYDPNDLAYVMVTILPICAALYIFSSGLKKLLLAAGMFVMGFTILLTGSRGGTLALLLIAMLAALRPLSLDRQGRLLEGRVSTILSRALILLVGLGMTWFAAPVEIKDRLMTLADIGSDYNMDLNDNSSRLLLWKRSSAAVFTRPIGFGLATFETVDGMLGGLYKTAHNTLVQGFVELGFLGLFFLLGAYYLSWRDLKAVERVCQNSMEPPTPLISRLALYSRALRISLAGNLAAGFFLSQAYGALLWMLIATCAAAIVLRQKALGELSGESASRKGRRARAP